MAILAEFGWLLFWMMIAVIFVVRAYRAYRDPRFRLGSGRWVAAQGWEQDMNPVREWLIGVLTSVSGLFITAAAGADRVRAFVEMANLGDGIMLLVLTSLGALGVRGLWKLGKRSAIYTSWVAQPSG